jgi:uncharacterized membrane protein YdjX (TVP38/TMEM64 family)
MGVETMTEKQKNTNRGAKVKKQSYDVSIQEEETDKQSRWPLIVTLILITSLVASYFVFPEFKNQVDLGWNVLTSGDKERISDWVSQFGNWGPFFIVLAMIAQMFLLVINVVALMLVSIIAYGHFWGSSIAIGAVLIASSIGYLVGRWVGQAGVVKLIGKKSENKINDFVEKYGLWAIVIARISPFLSNDAISFVAGLTKMNYLRFIGATLAGITPLTILLAWLGENNERLKSGLIWVSAISIVAFIAYIIFDKYFKNS